MPDISKIKLPGDSTARNVKDSSARTVQYSATLSASSWVQNGSSYTYTLSLPALTCGSDGTISPIISWTSNKTDYAKIDEADATAGVGIVFTASSKPDGAIGIIIQDNH